MLEAKDPGQMMRKCGMSETECCVGFIGHVFIIVFF